MILTIAIVSSAFLLTMVILVGCCFLRKRMRGHQQRSSYTEYSDQEPFEYSDQEPFVDNYQQGQQQRGSMDLNLASPDDEMMGNDTRDFGGEIHQCNNTAGLDITTQQTHTPPPTLRTVAFCEDYNITPQDQGGYTPLCIRGTSEPFTTSSSLPASPSPFHRMKSFSVTGCSPRLFPRPKLQHNSVSGNDLFTLWISFTAIKRRNASELMSKLMSKICRKGMYYLLARLSKAKSTTRLCTINHEKIS